jgi:ABC-type transporter Mla MlaB component
MATNAHAWRQQEKTLILQGFWLRDQVALALPLLPKSGIASVDMQAVTQVDSSLMTVLLSIRSESGQIVLRGVSQQVGSLLTLYGLNDFFIQDEAQNSA